MRRDTGAANFQIDLPFTNSVNPRSPKARAAVAQRRFPTSRHRRTLRCHGWRAEQTVITTGTQTLAGSVRAGDCAQARLTGARCDGVEQYRGRRERQAAKYLQRNEGSEEQHLRRKL